MTDEAQPECERLKEQILGLFPASAWVEVDTRDSLDWRVIVWGPALRRIRDWIGRCDSEGAALSAAHDYFARLTSTGDEVILDPLIMSHDLACALGELRRAGQHCAHVSVGDRAALTTKRLLEHLSANRDLTVAAVAFTVQLAIETGSEPSQMREMERTLFAALRPSVIAAE